MFFIQLEAENYDFFPMNRALCLSTIDIDSTESKIDDLLHQVTSIAQKQRDDVSVYVFISYEPLREKTNNLGSDQVRHRLPCTVTEAGWKLEELYLRRRGIALSV